MRKIIERLKSCPELVNLTLFTIVAIAITYFTKNYFAIFAPFIVAYLIARLMHPLVVKMNTKLKISTPLATIVCMVLFVAVAGFVLWVFGYYLLEGVYYLIDMLSSESTINKVVDAAQELGLKLDAFLRFLSIEISESDISSTVSEFAKKAITVLSNFSINVALKIPALLMALIIGGVAAFYMLSDYDKIAKAISSRLSPTTKRYVNLFNNQVLSSFVKMIFSYALISLCCFGELIVGFLILGLKDAAFIALLIAILDVLPVLGSGAVLIPWGILSILLGNTTMGIGLLVLYGIVTIVRQILEPKIVGAQIGLHPLLTIASLYLGLRLMGGLGLIMGPLFVLMWVKLAQEGLLFKGKTKRDSQDDEK